LKYLRYIFKYNILYNIYGERSKTSVPTGTIDVKGNAIPAQKKIFTGTPFPRCTTTPLRLTQNDQIRHGNNRYGEGCAFKR